MYIFELSEREGKLCRDTTFQHQIRYYENGFGYFPELSSIFLLKIHLMKPFRIGRFDSNYKIINLVCLKCFEASQIQKQKLISGVKDLGFVDFSCAKCKVNFHIEIEDLKDFILNYYKL